MAASAEELLELEEPFGFSCCCFDWSTVDRLWIKDVVVALMTTPIVLPPTLEAWG